MFAWKATPCWLALTTGIAFAADPEQLHAVRVAERARIEVMATAARSVVCIFEDNPAAAGGSGVIITPDGYGLTNFHVVAGMLKTRRGWGGTSDGRLHRLEVLGVDVTGDLAMFKLTPAAGSDPHPSEGEAPAGSFTPAPLGDSDTVRVGDWVFAMGNPFMLAEDYTPTVTHGIVSGTNRYQFGAQGNTLVYTDCIQVDASINPGNSGGPLFDMNGRLIGINGRASFEQRGRVNVGLGYAISINQVKRFIPGLRAGLLVEHGSLGATVVDIGRRVVFENMLESSPASAAGIQIGDRLLRFGGRDIHSANQFLNVLGTFPAGSPVEIVFERGHRAITRTMRLARVPAKLEGFKSDPDLSTAESEPLPAAPPPASAPAAEADSGFALAFDIANRRTVKLYGAAIGTQHGYQSGVIVAPDGKVVTALSLVLEAGNLRAVAHDGTVYRCEVLHRDDYRQLALLALSGSEGGDDAPARPLQMEAFEATKPAPVQPGDWVLAVGNPFKVAEGEEPLSILKGIVSGRASLAAFRGAQPFPYIGEVILVDAVTSSPGSAGSALVDLHGRLVGVVGEMVNSRQTNTLLNYALPVEEISAFLRDAQSATRPSDSPALAAGPGYHGIQLSTIGYRRQLPFVKSVARGSPAEAAGVRSDDLVISANGTAISQAADFTELCARLRSGETLALVVKRGEQLLTLRLILSDPPKR